MSYLDTIEQRAAEAHAVTGLLAACSRELTRRAFDAIAYGTRMEPYYRAKLISLHRSAGQKRRFARQRNQGELK